MKSLSIRGIRSGRICIGLALATTGVPLGMYFNHLFPVIPWSPFFMALSVLLIIRYGKLLAGRLPSFNRLAGGVILFQILMLLYGIPSSELTGQYLSFHLYIISLALALATNTKDINQYEHVIEWTFLLSAICSLLGAYYLWSGMLVGEIAWQNKQINEDYALEIFTASSAALINIACILYFPRRGRWWITLVLYLFFAIDFYIIFWGGKRTPLIVLAFIFSLYAAYRGRLFSTKWLMRGFILAFSSILVYASIESFSSRVDDAMYNIYAGVLNILGNSSVSDITGSAIERHESRSWAQGYIDKNFDALNYIFGGGYMTRWLDNPLFQAYLDMGILGFISYFFLVIVYPTKHMLRRKLSDLQLFTLSLCLYNILSFINSGHPYGHTKYTPILLLAHFTLVRSPASSQDFKYGTQHTTGKLTKISEARL